MLTGPAPYHDKHDMPADLGWLDVIVYLGVVVVVVGAISWLLCWGVSQCL